MSGESSRKKEALPKNWALELRLVSRNGIFNFDFLSVSFASSCHVTTMGKTNGGRKRKATARKNKNAELTEAERTKLILKYKTLTANPDANLKPGAVKALCKRFGVARNYASKLAQKLAKRAETETRSLLKSAERSGRPQKLTNTSKINFKNLLKTNSLNLPTKNLLRRSPTYLQQHSGGF